ncbi:hypothetical protein E3N88_20257 [Mikania micrantha]|uniref:Uncharacterized protein n=1 Tax=Mikania micrantha TaxID=192012 RepID=A0A5N6NGY5_9ASTR|nr:hypothetical protein E3N88_20257 [Mikania micrantha]
MFRKMYQKRFRVPPDLIRRNLSPGRIAWSRRLARGEPPVEYSYDTIDLNAEPNADVGFDSQASYGFVYDDSKQSYTEEGYEEKPGASNVNWETKEVT